MPTTAVCAMLPSKRSVSTRAGTRLFASGGSTRPSHRWGSPPAPQRMPWLNDIQNPVPWEPDATLSRTSLSGLVIQNVDGALNRTVWSLRMSESRSPAPSSIRRDSMPRLWRITFFTSLPCSKK
jgi:hypothetical protein